MYHYWGMPQQLLGHASINNFFPRRSPKYHSLGDNFDCKPSLTRELECGPMIDLYDYYKAYSVDLPKKVTSIEPYPVNLNCMFRGWLCCRRHVNITCMFRSWLCCRWYVNITICLWDGCIVDGLWTLPVCLGAGCVVDGILGALVGTLITLVAADLKHSLWRSKDLIRWQQTSISQLLNKTKFVSYSTPSSTSIHTSLQCSIYPQKQTMFMLATI